MNATQTLLLDLGEAAMMQRGFDGFSYADIARDAGIRKASIHYHFPTKQDLGLAVLHRYSQRLLERLAEIRQTARTGGQALTPRLVPLEAGAVIVEPWDPEFTREEIVIPPDGLEQRVLPAGEPFSRIWFNGQLWRPIGV